ncbi:MAG: hypothetical protein V9H26_19850 [Verrucomicrobiota bacterium]
MAKGFVFEAPDLTNSPVADLNDFQDQLCLLLASLHENQRLQVQYFCDSDYKGELLRYQQETEKFSNVWTKRARNERFTRYWQAMSERKLRRQRVIFYISRALENVPKSFQTAAARRDYYNTLLDQLRDRVRARPPAAAGNLRLGRRARPADVRSRPFPALQTVSQSVAQRPVRLRPGGRLRAGAFDSGKLLAQRRQRPV